MTEIKHGNQKSFNKSLCLSIVLGVSQFGQFIVFAVVFYAAGFWRMEYNLGILEVFTALFALIFGIYGAGMANQLVGDISKAKAAAQR